MDSLPAAPEEAYRLLELWLTYLKRRWPGYNDVFKGVDFKFTGIAHAREDGFVEYGIPIGLQAIRDPYAYNKSFAIRYVARQVVLQHELGHLAHSVLGMNYFRENMEEFAQANGLSMSAPLIGNQNEMAATDFSLLFLYDHIDDGVFLGRRLYSSDQGKTVLALEDHIDLSATDRQLRQRHVQEAIFKTLGIKEFDTPFPMEAMLELSRHILPNPVILRAHDKYPVTTGHSASGNNWGYSPATAKQSNAQLDESTTTNGGIDMKNIYLPDSQSEALSVQQTGFNAQDLIGLKIDKISIDCEADTDFFK